MIQITVSDEQAVHIRSTKESIELVDRAGIVIGKLQSAEDVRRSPLSLSELEARRQQVGGKPLSEIINGLRERE